MKIEGFYSSIDLQLSNSAYQLVSSDSQQLKSLHHVVTLKSFLRYSHRFIPILTELISDRKMSKYALRYCTMTSGF